ncbi:GntR family transcriptional regulator [Aeoliella sp. ICT_H6.2]|uniref:GntR family transcriptional regulator n=1 Tax=Aeoliella straminimaris TaxID=2954799 RepID=A0A9X2F9B6_9BACT|nr:GntR family transcriptional regulator [Aeoliella straminimaris]MCO6044765.1 GntR family transcriptional regulator [Aeoliella straminimaris]
MSTTTQANRAYEHLRDKLIAGQFEPGTRLLYGPIGREIGVSATPVREAAGQLAQEGLIDLIPQLGAVVRRLDRSELIEIYEVRLAIEPYAARLAALRANNGQIARLEKKLARLMELTTRQKGSASKFASKRTASQFNKADCEFHLCMIEATGNREMMRAAGQSHGLTRVFGTRRHRFDASSMQATCDEHKAILDAIRSKAPIRAAKAAAKHISNGLQLSLQGAAAGSSA